MKSHSAIGVEQQQNIVVVCSKVKVGERCERKKWQRYCDIGRVYRLPSHGTNEDLSRIYLAKCVRNQNVNAMWKQKECLIRTTALATESDRKRERDNKRRIEKRTQRAISSGGGVNRATKSVLNFSQNGKAWLSKSGCGAAKKSLVLYHVRHIVAYPLILRINGMIIMRFIILKVMPQAALQLNLSLKLHQSMRDYRATARLHWQSILRICHLHAGHFYCVCDCLVFY